MARWKVSTRVLVTALVAVHAWRSGAQSWELIEPQIKPARVMDIAVPPSGDEFVVATDPDGAWHYDPLFFSPKLEFANIDANFGYSIHTWGAAYAPSDAGVVYVGGKLSLTSRSSNGGDSWSGYVFSGKGAGMAVHPTDPNVVAEGSGGRVTRWANNGLGWTQKDAAGIPANVQVTDIIYVDSSTVWVSTSDTFQHYDYEPASGWSDGYGFLVSTNFSSPNPSFTPRTTDLADSRVNHITRGLGSGDVYAATETGLWRSTNAGVTWTNGLFEMPPGASRVYDVHFNLGVAEDILIGTDAGVFKGYDDPDDPFWTPVNAFPRAHPTNSAVVVSGRGTLVYVGYSDGTVYKSTDFGATATKIAGGTGAFSLQTVAMNGDDHMYVGVSCQQGIFNYHADRSYPWLKAWTTEPGEEGRHHYPMRIVQHPTQPNLAYATIFASVNRTTDAGVTWHPYGAAPYGADTNHLHGLAIAPSSPNVMYVGSGYGYWGALDNDDLALPRIAKSTDGGLTWVQHATGKCELESLIAPIPCTVETRSVCEPHGVCAPLQNYTLQGTILGQHQCRVLDPGCNLSLPRTGEKIGTSMYDIAVSPTDPNVLHVATFGNENYPEQEGEGKGVLRSTDGGGNWDPLPLPGGVLSNWVGRIASVSTGGTLRTYVATLNGIYTRTGTTGTAWTPISSGAVCDPPGPTNNCPLDTRFEALAVDPGDPFTLYVGTSPMPNPITPPCGAAPAFPKIYKGVSVNNGANWTWTQMTIPTSDAVSPPIWSLTYYDPNPGCPRYRVRDIAMGATKGYAVIEGAGVYVLNKTCSGTSTDLQASFSASPQSVADGTAITFNSTSSGNVASCSWNWGDGSAIESGCFNRSHTFPSAGVYTVTLTAVGSGCPSQDTAQQVIVVYDTSGNPNLVASIDSYVDEPYWHNNRPTVRPMRYDTNAPSKITSRALEILDKDFTALPGAATEDGSLHFGNNIAAGRVEGPCSPSPCFEASASIAAAKGHHINSPAVVALFQWNTGYKRMGSETTVFAGTTYGAKVAVLDMDGDGAGDVCASKGPGSALNDEVRCFEWSGSALVPMWGTNFRPFSTAGYGVTLGGADLNALLGGADELLTGKGPGPTFTPTVRGWKCPSGCTSPPSSPSDLLVDFDAYDPVGFKGGAEVSGGQLDADARHEIVTAPGQTAVNGIGNATTLRMWNYSGTNPPSQGAELTDVFGAQYKYGLNISVGEFDSDHGYHEVVAGTGPQSDAIPTIRGLLPSASTFADLTPALNLPVFPPGSGAAPGYQGEPRYGLTVAASKQPFSPNTGGGYTSTDRRLEALRDVIAMIDESGWTGPGLREAMLADIDWLLANLPTLDIPTILARIAELAAQVTGILNDDLRYAMYYEIGSLSALYQTGDFRTGATVAVVPAPEVGTLASVQTGGATPDHAYVVGRDAGPSPTSHNRLMELPSAALYPASSRPGIVADEVLSLADAHLYGVRLEEAGCGEDCYRATVERSNLAATTPIWTSQEVATLTTGGDVPRALVVAPGLHDTSEPAKAYISATDAVALPGSCPSGGGDRGYLVVVKDLAQVPSAQVAVLPHDTPHYEDLAASPVPGDGRVYAIHACGVDVVDVETDAIQELAIAGISGDRLRAARAADARDRLYALDTAAGILASHDLEAGTTSTVALPLARDLEVAPDGSQIVVLTGEDGGRLEVLDGATLAAVRTVPVGVSGGAGGTEIELTADGTNVLIVDGSRNVIEVVWMAWRTLARRADLLVAATAGLQDRALGPGAQGLRTILLMKLGDARDLAAQADATPAGPARDELLEDAMDVLRDHVMSRMDGDFGGLAEDDFLATPEHRAMLYRQVKALDHALMAEHSSAAP